MNSTRLQSLSNQSLLRLNLRIYFSIDRLMRESTEGGLQYGWDFPTFSVLFTRKWRAYNRLTDEGRLRFGSRYKIDNELWNNELETFNKLRKITDRRMKRKRQLQMA